MTVAPSGKRLIPSIVAISLLLPLLLAGTARSADLSASSSTYLRYYQRDLGGTKYTYAPLYEYLSADAANLGGAPVALHFYGWGRVDLSDPSGSGKESGGLGSAYLEYLHPKGNAQMKLGRFFLTEGVAVETLDGAFFKVTTPVGIGISGYGGVPVEQSTLDNATTAGNSLYGGRLFFNRSGVTEIGVSYLKEKGPFQGKDRELYGGDLWLRIAPPVEVTAQATYNQSTKGMASQRYALRVTPGSRFDISAGYEAYSYKDLFQTAVHPAFISSSLFDNTDKVRTIFGVLDWEVVSGLTLELAAKSIRHDNVMTGNANRGEAGVRYVFNDKKDVFGLSAAAVTADQEKNEYQEFRGFVTWSPAKFHFSLDALTQKYKKEIDGRKNAHQLVASAGYKVRPYLSVSGDMTYTQSPTFQQDYAGLFRATLELGTATGGKK